MTVTNFEGRNANLPVGSIISWHREIADIPFGWALCDGNNGTPNLIETFPRGVPDGATDPGGVGGNKSITLSESQLPSHGHNPGSTGIAGEHRHQIGDTGEWNSNTDPWYQPDSNGSGASTKLSGDHTHGSTNTANQGGGASIDNQPAYEETLFIKRID